MMIKVDTDIDIDVANRDELLKNLPHICAMNNKNGIKTRHPTGVYFQDIPVDPITNLAAFDYEKASDFGYFKIDFLNNSIYDSIKDEEHLDRLLNTEPLWELFEHQEIVETLPQIGNSFYIVQQIKPKSIEDLAVVIALIRPGKRHLIYKSRSEIDLEIWKKTDEYTFKRAHAIAYAVSIIVKLNLICEEMS